MASNTCSVTGHVEARSRQPNLTSLPEVPLCLVFDHLSRAPGVYSPRLSANAISLSTVCRTLNRFYRECYVTSLVLIDPGTSVPPAVVHKPEPPGFARMLARFPSAASVDITHFTYLKVEPQLVRRLLVGNRSQEEIERARRIRSVNLTRPVSRSELYALVECCPSLSSLELHGFGSLDCAPIAKLVALQSLRFVHCCLSAGLGHNSLGSLSKLTELVMRYCRIRSGGLASIFKSVAPCVTHLDVRWCHSLSPGALAVLPPLLTELKVDAFRPWRGVNCLPQSFCEAKQRLSLIVQGKMNVGAVLFDSGKIAETWLSPVAERLVHLDAFEFDFAGEYRDGNTEDSAAVECLKRMRNLQSLRVGHVGHDMAVAIASLPRLEYLEFNEATFRSEAVQALGSGNLARTLKVCDFRKAMYVPKHAVEFLRSALPDCAVKTR